MNASTNVHRRSRVGGTQSLCGLCRKMSTVLACVTAEAGAARRSAAVTTGQQLG